MTKIFKESLLNNTMPPGQEALSFEEFIRCNPTPRYNNFFLYFVENERGESYRSGRLGLYYQRFAREHPDLATSLADKIQRQLRLPEWTKIALKPIERDLYEAYKIMCSLGGDPIDLLR